LLDAGLSSKSVLKCMKWLGGVKPKTHLHKLYERCPHGNVTLEVSKDVEVTVFYEDLTVYRECT
jgi:hypothetical protein